ncbi:SDR family NAD(P)-dependent oxidoreductase [Piscinibacter gummiphilus]|uniref:SDR family NAD(P)-dependent oxidoreductase n=1 Tax=Piscinibacter gummiphilus TaxID=946333 RepID=A0ABZ0CUL1_9BURK|nr:SDR family NAD(P)-dependent oxidoreductase [Piscinibacter gummiphilus]WOB08649.1 SDR family NAD(P)-dependent oxidoreductase [Piscinibacter gummiphilus]
MKRLEGKSAVVTGAASGIGRATAKLFAEQGAKVVAVDRAPEVEATVADIRAAGGTAIALQRDTSQEKDVADYIETAVRHHGGLDVCFANAGVSGGMGAFDEWTVEEWNRVLSINLVGTFLAIKYATRVMVPAGHGSIICTASVAGLRSGAGGPPYSASKAGVISLVQTSANQFGGTGVRINAICPGLIETGMTKPVFDRARERGTENKIGQLNPLRRGGLPHEIAYAALFLASDDASYVNGQAIPVDGGLSSSLPVVPPKM